MQSTDEGIPRHSNVLYELQPGADAFPITLTPWAFPEQVHKLFQSLYYNTNPFIIKTPTGRTPSESRRSAMEFLLLEKFIAC